MFSNATQDVSEPPGHARTEIQPHRAEHRDDAASHVLTAVLTDAFDYGNRATVAHREALTGLPSDKQLPGSCTVQNGVTGENVSAFGSGDARADGDVAARKPLPHIVIGFAEKFQGHTFAQKSAEALPRRAPELPRNRRLHSILEARPHAFAAELRAHAAMKIVNCGGFGILRLGMFTIGQEGW